ncbi:trimethylamine--corrinoid protein Co-methyltransferase [Rhodoligotrophos appendicifer]|uniref:trimethylamine methyltransferase family protein n=1 Tax=Rhodoligotrophos appendicifer TaxID=987056 RepID=UPI00117DDC58|nr:trimethylamine methyltransferase family protein [Rhodoligotrophos appendicifer]
MTRRGKRSQGVGTASRIAGTIRQAPFRQVQFNYPPMEILSKDHIAHIHDASLRILENIGMRILEPRAREYFRKAGASVDEQSFMVKLDRHLVLEKLRLAPSEFLLEARNPSRNVHVGGINTFFSAVGGPAFVQDLDRGRRAGTYAEVCDFLKVIQSLNILHQEGGSPFEAMDVHEDIRHLDLHLAQITLLDKNWQPWGLGRIRAKDGLEMIAITLGIDREYLTNHVVFTCIINTNSPLTLDIPMAEGLIEMARHGQAVVITPFTLAGAMSPITITGSLAQQNAEALACITLAQCVRPGAPVVYGAFTTNVDMRTGSPAFGTPEYTQAAQISGQLARFYNLPFRSSNVTASNEVDAQAAYESQMSLWGAVMGHAHMVNHAAGWLGGGLTASFEKLILDAEMLQMMAAYLTPPVMDEESLGLNAIQEVGPGGHFFGTEHTLQRYEDAFYSSMISDGDNYENWRDKGSLTATQQANRIWKQLLHEYEKPPLDAAVEEALQDYVRRRKAEIKSGIDTPSA